VAGLQWLLGKEENLKDTVSVSLETADPAKFPEIITELISYDPPMPKHLADAQVKKEILFDLTLDYQEFKKFLLVNKR